MHPATIMSFFVINDIIKVHAHARTYICANKPYTQRKREVRSFFTLDKGFAIPE